MQTTRWDLSRQEIAVKQGAVSAKHPLTSRIGVQVLQEGGNAIDAAVTAALVNAVLEPAYNGIGGGGLMLYHEAKTGRSYCLDYFIPAPLAATDDMYEVVSSGATDSLGFRGIKDDANLFGYRSIGVPGLIAGMELALKQFGTRSLKEALQPAIHYAEAGFEADWYFMLTTARFMELVARYPATAEIYLKQGKYIYRTDGMGSTDLVVQRDLAESLRYLAAEGAHGFYQGDLAHTLVEDLATHGGLFCSEDLAQYQPHLTAARQVTYRDRYQLVFAPNSGGSTLAETFNILEGYDFSGMQPRESRAVHPFIEAARIAYADRWQHLADERFGEVPWQILESKDYANHRRQDIQMDKAAAQVAALAAGTFSPAGEQSAGGCTTHISVVDKDHNMVAITQTINQLWGSGVVVPGTGILLNDAMVLFDPLPGRANSIQGGKRPLSSMTPMLVLKDGKPFVTAGAPGGRLIIGTVMQLLHNIMDYDMGIQTACANITLDCSRPRVVVDDRFPAAVYQELQALGHSLRVKPQAFLPRPFASPAGILVDPDTGELRAGADPYHPGEAAGF